MKITLLVIVMLTWCSAASAQGLVVPTAVFATASAADWTTTYRSPMKETNPLISKLQGRPALMVATGAGIDVAGTWAWNRYIGRRHRKVAIAGLYAAAAFRVFLAARNASGTHRYEAKIDAWRGHAPGF